MKTKIKLSKKELEYLKISAKMTPLDRLKWLEEMRQFTIRTLSHKKLTALFNLRTTT